MPLVKVSVKDRGELTDEHRSCVVKAAVEFQSMDFNLNLGWQSVHPQSGHGGSHCGLLCYAYRWHLCHYGRMENG